MTEPLKQPVPEPRVLLRPAQPDDALCLSVLAMQVFLDTYATQGIRPAIAREVLSSFAQAEFDRAIAASDSRIAVAERQGHLVGFAQLTLRARHALAPAGVQAELLRLYVQEPFTGATVGTQLLAQAERFAAASGAGVLWLTPWVHNHRALAFLRAAWATATMGFATFSSRTRRTRNRLLAKRLDSADAADAAA